MLGWNLAVTVGSFVGPGGCVIELLLHRFLGCLQLLDLLIFYLTGDAVNRPKCWLRLLDTYPL